MQNERNSRDRSSYAKGKVGKMPWRSKSLFGTPLERPPKRGAYIVRNFLRQLNKIARR